MIIMNCVFYIKVLKTGTKHLQIPPPQLLIISMGETISRISIQDTTILSKPIMNRIKCSIFKLIGKIFYSS